MSSHVYRLRPFAQHYEWGKLGHESAVARLVEAGKLGAFIDPAKPYAELWMGDHPNGPCFVHNGTEDVPIWYFLKSFGEDVKIPFLFKVLSVGKALSIQSHPDAVLAKKLHAEFPAIYKDPNPKPELAIALTEFKALFGFRPFAEISKFIQELPALAALVGSLHSDSIKLAYSALMTAPHEEIAKAIDAICNSESSDPEIELARDLNRQYPGGDVGVLSVFFLNVVTLSPGECLFMGPNVPHAYLSGDIIECMTSSDNVIRGGLTPKFKDVPTLLGSLDFASTNKKDRLKPSGKQQHHRWAPPNVPFAVSKHESNSSSFERSAHFSIALVTHGSGHLDNLSVHEGSVVLIEPNHAVTLRGDKICVYHAFSPSS